MNASTAFDTVLSLDPIENTSDMWLSPLAMNMVGQWPTPSLALGPSRWHSSSCTARDAAGICRSSPTPPSSSAYASMIATRVDRKPSCVVNTGASVAAAGAAGPRPPPRPAGGGGGVPCAPVLTHSLPFHAHGELPARFFLVSAAVAP